MNLPAVERAAVDEAKVRDYLLSDSHPVGRFKAAFFRSLGYSAADWQRLSADLRHHARTNPAVATRNNEYGQTFEVRGRLEGPAGRLVMVRAVWIVRRGEDVPRFVTAFPG